MKSSFFRSGRTRSWDPVRSPCRRSSGWSRLNVELAGVDVVPGRDLLLGEATDHVQLPLEGVPLVGSAPQEELADPRPVEPERSPRNDGSTGTSRHPRTGHPSAAAIRSMARSTARRAPRPWGERASPRRTRRAGEVEPVARAHLAEENVGIARRRPAPSPWTCRPQGAAGLQVHQDPDSPARRRRAGRRRRLRAHESDPANCRGRSAGRTGRSVSVPPRRLYGETCASSLPCQLPFHRVFQLNYYIIAIRTCR